MELAGHCDGSGQSPVITYGYLSGRVLAPSFALGLLFFATTKQRFVGVLKIWLAYAVTLVPLILFNRSHSGVLTKRLYEVSYIRFGAPWKEIPSQFAEFVRCYLQDQSLTPLLMTGDLIGIIMSKVRAERYFLPHSFWQCRSLAGHYPPLA